MTRRQLLGRALSGLEPAPGSLSHTPSRPAAAFELQYAGEDDIEEQHAFYGIESVRDVPEPLAELEDLQCLGQVGVGKLRLTGDVCGAGRQRNERPFQFHDISVT